MPLRLITRVLHNVMFDQTEKMILITLTWHIQEWYPVVANANSQANSPSQRSFRQQTSITTFDNKQFNDVKSVKNSWKTLSLSKISETDLKLFTGARRVSSKTNYKSAWRKWVGWCSRRHSYRMFKEF